MDYHLGYTKNHSSGHGTGNSRNGYSSKKLIRSHGDIQINTPRDRNAEFEPELIKKGQSRITGTDNQILSLYAKGMSTRDIVDAFQEMYGADISAGLVSQVTNSVLEKVVEWQSRPLDAIYPIVYFDCIVIKIRQDKKVINNIVTRFHFFNLCTTVSESGTCTSELRISAINHSMITALVSSPLVRLRSLTNTQGMSSYGLSILFSKILSMHVHFIVTIQ